MKTVLDEILEAEKKQNQKFLKEYKKEKKETRTLGAILNGLKDKE